MEKFRTCAAESGELPMDGLGKNHALGWRTTGKESVAAVHRCDAEHEPTPFPAHFISRKNMVLLCLVSPEQNHNDLV